MARSSVDRLPHVILDRDSRAKKARKIVEIIGHEKFFSARRILEVGCGSGVISAALAEMSASDVDVHAVDVVDNRIEFEGYDFELVGGLTLPFEDGYFDLVITNHVIEHVGEFEDQLTHLREIARVTSDAGVVYLAVPNRWRLIEPHYKLAFLSWLPLRLADRYLRIAGKGERYDCVPLSLGGIRRLLYPTVFAGSNRTMDAFYVTSSLEFEGRLGAMLRTVPRWMIMLTMPFIPTFVFVLSKKKEPA